MSESMSAAAGTILLAGGDARQRALIEEALARCASLLKFCSAGSAAEAIGLLDTARFDLVIAAHHLPDASGADLTRHILKARPGLPVWIVDAEGGDPQAAVEALGAGAADYLPLDPLTLAKLPYLVSRIPGRGDGAAPAAPTMRADRRSDLAEIAHDLRSPLSGLVALLDLLVGEVDGPLTPPQRNRLGRIAAAIQRLIGMVDGISDLARVEAGRLTLSRRPIDLEEVMRGAKQALDPALSSRALGLQLILPADLPPMHGDPARIRQIITALMTGLLRQVEGTALELEAAGRGSMVEVTLREASRGIPVEALPASFVRMRETDGGVGDDAGACRGIGLSLAKGLTQLHGGDLKIGRDADGGVYASFTLPAAGPDAAPRLDRPADLRRTT